ncbi:alpha-ketoglutarate-dependent dioxygenase AlkB, partial [Paracidovorax oryzae]|uniref:alpha-ketoglutarate-dependent dioxygenase AlkB n=1 Tax=Paracidovorax oryzae TaxID=862720 RepID=UPI000495E217
MPGSSSTTPDLFDGDPAGAPAITLGPGAALLRGFALPVAPVLREGVLALARIAPWRHMETPGGRAMSVATTSCGRLGWVSDHRGYRYAPLDPESGTAWPAMPDAFRRLGRA